MFHYGYNGKISVIVEKVGYLRFCKEMDGFREMKVYL
jgi:hypothetical protein